MEPIRISCDAWIFRYQKLGGINTYFRKLIAYTSRLGCRWTINGDHETIHPTPEFTSVKFTRNRQFGLGPKADYQLNRARQYIRDRCATDLYHPSYYDWIAMSDARIISKPLLVTVHDCIHERFPEWQQKDPHCIPAKIRMLRMADQIVCISQHTADDLVHFYPWTKDRIRVILSGTDLRPPSGTAQPRLDSFLYVGTRKGYKNFDTLLDALAQCHRLGKPLRLKVVGPEPDSTDLENAKTAGIAHAIEWLGFVSDDQLPALYHHSIALVYPSLYEGFGLPALDAMACGSTVIAHKGSCLPEVVGDGGLLVDASDPTQLRDAMISLSESEDTRSDLLNRAKQRASSLSWDATAHHYLNTYRSLI